MLQRLRARATTEGQWALTSTALTNLSQAALARGEIDQAIALDHQALEAARRAGAGQRAGGAGRGLSAGRLRWRHVPKHQNALQLRATPASEDEVRAAALQYVRKISGFTRPSQANAEAFERAVEEVAEISLRLLAELTTNAAPKDREIEAAKARARAAERYGRAA